MIGIIGLGFVGNALKKSFESKNIKVIGYDKFKESDEFKDILKTDIVFLCLPTQFDEQKNEYDKSCIEEISQKFEENNYLGIVVIKSTVEPLTTKKLGEKYKILKFVHNPEFLTARTAFEDFHNQKHIVLGKSENISEKELLVLSNFYKTNYPDAEISICSSTESESMKSFVNCFYAVKVQFFTELYCLCEKNGSDYNVIKNLMLKNGWINPMHTIIPGPDGQISYGGYCFPKDTNALLQYMKNENSPSAIMDACIKERNEMRNDNVNIK